MVSCIGILCRFRTRIWGSNLVDDSILIVDDSSYIEGGLMALLKRKGFKPIASHGGDRPYPFSAPSNPI